MGALLLRISVVYFVIGVLAGLVMGITQNFQYASVHAHINLLGWVSLALAGIIYYLFPAAGTSKLGKIHFWLHNVGLAVMIVGLYLEVADIGNATPLIASGGSIAVIGVILFAINVWTHVKEKAIS